MIPAKRLELGVHLSVFSVLQRVEFDYAVQVTNLDAQVQRIVHVLQVRSRTGVALLSVSPFAFSSVRKESRLHCQPHCLLSGPVSLGVGFR